MNHIEETIEATLDASGQLNLYWTLFQLDRFFLAATKVWRIQLRSILILRVMFHYGSQGVAAPGECFRVFALRAIVDTIKE